MLSARNQLPATVKTVKLGNVMAEVIMSVGDIENRGRDHPGLGRADESEAWRCRQGSHQVHGSLDRQVVSVPIRRGSA